MSTTPERSALMRRVRQHGTGAELAVRRLLTRLGARYRLNVRGLPGTPDIANRSKAKAIFVHGCFWHAHEHCARATVPKSNAGYWTSKLKANAERDARKIQCLRDADFEVVVIWECELRRIHELSARLKSFWFS